MELRLVLEAAGIAARANHHRGWWTLTVDASDAATAEAELEEYRNENLSQSNPAIQVAQAHGGGGLGVMVYSAVIISIALLTLPWGMGWNLFSPGQMQAGLVMSGEVWRTVTALTLHLDEGHLASNIVFGILFGYLAGRTLGGGVAWLSIVIAGALGNLANAFVQPPEHNSIGASTAVFAALGILVADALRIRKSTRESLLHRWSPIVGGIMLLSFIGVGGGRVDVIAHVTGFLAGLIIGWTSSRIPQRWLASRRVQQAAGIATLALVAIAWGIALLRN